MRFINYNHHWSARKQTPSFKKSLHILIRPFCSTLQAVPPTHLPQIKIQRFGRQEFTGELRVSYQTDRLRYLDSDSSLLWSPSSSLPLNEINTFSSSLLHTLHGLQPNAIQYLVGIICHICTEQISVSQKARFPVVQDNLRHTLVGLTNGPSSCLIEATRHTVKW